MKMMKHHILSVLTLAGFALFSASALAQDDPPDAEQREQWKAAYRRIAESITMRSGPAALDLHPTPLLFYTNPVRHNDQHGTIFLWTDEGRPAVFGSIWSARNRLDPTVRFVTHEWHSLLEAPETLATRGETVLWVSGEPGVRWQSLEDAPAPSNSRTVRLLQMRNIVRGLSARIVEEEVNQLRLMPQPLYRYPEDVSDAIDGALFAFTLATDPELIAVVEAQNDGPTPTWRVAFARFGALPMSVHNGQREMWSCDRVKPPLPQGKYHLIWRAEEMPADPIDSTRVEGAP
ncbi:MAG: hypothetical protein KY475_27525 [Planctomycetes bacterium]|nr:hypothetical protein [Planctomycetota bacterium]